MKRKQHKPTPTVAECRTAVIVAACSVVSVVSRSKSSAAHIVKRDKADMVKALREQIDAVIALLKAERAQVRKPAMFHIVKRGRWGLVSYAPTRWRRGNGELWSLASAELIAPIVGGRIEVAFQ